MLLARCLVLMARLWKWWRGVTILELLLGGYGWIAPTGTMYGSSFSISNGEVRVVLYVFAERTWSAQWQQYYDTEHLAVIGDTIDEILVLVIARTQVSPHRSEYMYTHLRPAPNDPGFALVYPNSSSLLSANDPSSHLFLLCQTKFLNRVSGEADCKVSMKRAGERERKRVTTAKKQEAVK